MIGSLREQLVTDLGALDVPVFSAWQDRVVVPCVMVAPPQTASYVAGGRTFGEYLVSVDVVALVSKGSPALALGELELLIEAVLSNSVDWSLSGVDSPSVTTIGTVEALGTIIHLSKPSRL